MSSVIDEGQLKSTSNFMFKLLTAIGIVVAFIVGIIIGIQFLVASAEDKAKVKEALIPYVVGCIVIFGAFTIWSIVVNMGQEITSSSSGGGTQSSTSQNTTKYSVNADGTKKCATCGTILTETMLNQGKCFGCQKKIAGLVE